VEDISNKDSLYFWMVHATAMLSSSSNVLGESSGSRRVAVSSSRNAFGGADSDLRARATESNRGKSHINSTGQRSSQIGSSDPNRVAASSKHGSSHVKNYENAVKGIEGLKL
jgi:casein kinase 1